MAILCLSAKDSVNPAHVQPSPLSLEPNPSQGHLPGIAIRRTGTTVSVQVGATPLGSELSTLVLGLLQIDGHQPSQP